MSDALRIIGPARLSDALLLVVAPGGAVTAYCGHVDLGTGIRTALAQIVAEELDVPFASVTMVLGDTETAPDQGATIASETIQVTAVPLRQAAAQARQILLGLAADATGMPAGMLRAEDGVVLGPDGSNLRIAYAALLAGHVIIARLDEKVAVKQPADYRIVGQPVPRADIPDKATGRTVYVHDVRLPGMLHGRVVRPPYGGLDHGPFFGRALLAVDREAVAAMPGFVDLMVRGDFIGVIAEREEQAEQIAASLPVRWAPVPIPDLSDLEAALEQNPASPREVHRRGDVEAALAAAPVHLERRYLWPYQMHASIGPSCAVADWREGRLTVWSGTQNPHMLRADLALLTGLPETAIAVIRQEASGCYGRNCADDVSGDAALLAMAVRRPVRVQLTRAQEHVWEPKGAAQLMHVRGGASAAGDLLAYDFATRYPSNVSPLLALLLTGIVPAEPVASSMGDRTAVPPYAYESARVTVHDMPPIARASWFRGVSALPNSFAHDCFVDELAAEAGEDPVAYRLRHLPDERARDLLRAVAARADWQPRVAPAPAPDPAARILRGRGAAYAQYVHGTFPGVPAAWSAWIADVAVDRATGQVAVTRVVVGQDSGMMINPAGVRHQIHGNVIQSTSRALKEQVPFDTDGVAAKDWGTYPILTFLELPEIDVLMLPRPDEPPKGAGESASVPSAAAIANALYDATGIRFRELPFTPERIKAGLDAVLPALPPDPAPRAQPALPSDQRQYPATRRLSARLKSLGGLPKLAALAAACAALGGFAAGLSPLRPAFAPIPPPDPALFSTAAVARGRDLAALGDCAVCHTAPGGAPMAGGLRLATDFGTIVTTNITPDVRTGIGAWSYPAFARAMREGISRDGHHLYPAFPYPSFAKINEDDMQALYAYLMTLPPVAHAVPPTALKFPYNQRWAMAGWNTLFLGTAPFTPDPARSASWNRGAYLAEGLAHCGACHTPRNALGAERASAYFGGGVAEGWDAPALSSLSRAPLLWTQQDVFDYLRHGFSARHGPAAGPMAPVVVQLQALPDSDIRAIAEYVASFDQRNQGDDPAALEQAAAARLALTAGAGNGARIFGGSCAACHEGEAPHMFGNRPSLALNSNLYAARPDNLIRVILNGSTAALPGGGAMPSFRDVLNDTQLADLITYLRATFAPGAPAWADLPRRIVALRQAHPP